MGRHAARAGRYPASDPPPGGNGPRRRGDDREARCALRPAPVRARFLPERGDVFHRRSVRGLGDGDYAGRSLGCGARAGRRGIGACERLRHARRRSDGHIERSCLRGPCGLRPCAGLVGRRRASFRLCQRLRRGKKPQRVGPGAGCDEYAPPLACHGAYLRQAAGRERNALQRPPGGERHASDAYGHSQRRV